MARQPRTPGATEAPKTTETEVVTTTTAGQADAALNAILGAPDSKGAETTASTEATGTGSEPVTPELTAEDLQAKKEYEEFLEWRNSKGKKASATGAAQHVPTSDATGSVQVQTFLSPDGWTSKGGE